MSIFSFLQRAYAFKGNAFSIFLYVLTVLLVLEMYMLGSRSHYMAIGVMIAVAIVLSMLTKNMLVILLGALTLPAIGVLIQEKMR